MEPAVVAGTFMLLLTLGTQAGTSGHSASLHCRFLCCPGSGLELCGSSSHRPTEWEGMREGTCESLVPGQGSNPSFSHPNTVLIEAGEFFVAGVGGTRRCVLHSASSQ